jgi:hypothetical protein
MKRFESFMFWSIMTLATLFMLGTMYHAFAACQFCVPVDPVGSLTDIDTSSAMNRSLDRQERNADRLTGMINYSRDRLNHDFWQDADRSMDQLRHEEMMLQLESINRSIQQEQILEILE